MGTGYSGTVGGATSVYTDTVVFVVDQSAFNATGGLGGLTVNGVLSWCTSPTSNGLTAATVNIAVSGSTIIASGTSIATSGSGYPTSATFNLLVAGGTGGIINVTTSSSGVMTFNSVVAGGTGYSAGTNNLSVMTSNGYYLSMNANIIGIGSFLITGSASTTTTSVIANTTTSAPITATATSLSVSSASGFPAAPFQIMVDGDSTTSCAETMTVTNVSGSTLTLSARPRGTAHASGVSVVPLSASFTVSSASGFSAGSQIVVDKEPMLVTSVSGSTFVALRNSIPCNNGYPTVQSQHISGSPVVLSYPQNCLAQVYMNPSVYFDGSKGLTVNVYCWEPNHPTVLLIGPPANAKVIAPSSALNGAIDSSVTSVVVTSTTGFPATPFNILVEPNTLNSELMTVTSVTRSALSVTRSSSPYAHTNNAQVLLCTTLNTSMAIGATTLIVNTNIFPSTVPFNLIIEPQTSNQEVITVTSFISGTVFAINPCQLAHTSGVAIILQGITNGFPAKVTCANHGLLGVGEDIVLVDLGGMTYLNQIHTACGALVDINNFYLNAYDPSPQMGFDTTYLPAYTGGGYVCLFQANAIGDSALYVDMDVSNEWPWNLASGGLCYASNPRVCVVNISRAADVDGLGLGPTSQINTITSLTSGANPVINLQYPLNRAKQAGSYVIVLNRNVRFTSSGAYAGNGIFQNFVFASSMLVIKAEVSGLGAVAAGTGIGSTSSVLYSNLTGAVSGPAIIGGAYFGNNYVTYALYGYLQIYGNAITAGNSYAFGPVSSSLYGNTICVGCTYVFNTSNASQLYGNSICAGCTAVLNGASNVQIYGSAMLIGNAACGTSSPYCQIFGSVICSGGVIHNGSLYCQFFGSVICTGNQYIYNSNSHYGQVYGSVICTGNQSVATSSQYLQTYGSVIYSGNQYVGTSTYAYFYGTTFANNFYACNSSSAANSPPPSCFINCTFNNNYCCFNQVSVECNNCSFNGSVYSDFYNSFAVLYNCITPSIVATNYDTYVLAYNCQSTSAGTPVLGADRLWLPTVGQTTFEPTVVPRSISDNYGGDFIYPARRMTLGLLYPTNASEYLSYVPAVMMPYTFWLDAGAHTFSIEMVKNELGYKPYCELVPGDRYISVETGDALTSFIMTDTVPSAYNTGKQTAVLSYTVTTPGYYTLRFVANGPVGNVWFSWNHNSSIAISAYTYNPIQNVNSVIQNASSIIFFTMANAPSTPTISLAVNGGSFNSIANSIATVAAPVYSLTLTTAQTSTLGTLVIKIINNGLTYYISSTVVAGNVGQIASGTVSLVNSSYSDFNSTSSDLSGNNNDYNNMWLVFTSGNNKFIPRVITTYEGSVP